MKRPLLTADPKGQDTVGPGAWRVGISLAPAMLVIVLLFGGGLALGFFQSLGYLPAAGLKTIHARHYLNVLADPDFSHSLLMTFYVALTATSAAAAVSIVMALALTSLGRRWRPVQFIFQIPLTVPHLVIAVAVIFMLAPSGLFSRLLTALGWIQNQAQFPLVINDRWSLGIMVAYIWKEVPFITLMLLSVLLNSGTELLEVGRTLKAGPWQRFRYITLPLITPSLGAACLIVFAYTFGAFEIPYLLGRTYPLLLPVWAYKNYSDVDLMARPEGIAIGILIAAIVIVAVVVAHRLLHISRRKGVLS